MSKEGLGLEITELTLAPPGRGQNLVEKNEKKRGFWEVEEGKGGESGGGNGGGNDGRSTKIGLPAAKSQVVGWPPVCSYRRKNSFSEKDHIEGETSKMYVKVSMDGAVYLRKIDLSMQKGYCDLARALEQLFGCYGIADQASKEGDNAEYMLIYEDKDGDWMLAGDVPWKMFMETCKRLRIMKRSEARDIGLQPRDFLKGNLKDNS